MTALGSSPFLPSPYHSDGRQGNRISGLVVHWMCGTLAGTDAEFTHGSRRVSAHLGIENALQHRYVNWADTAWHCGSWPGNLTTIGIEHSAAPDRPASAQTIATSVTSMVELCHENGLGASQIYPHNHFSSTDCPGNLPLAQIMKSVAAILGGKPPYIPPVGALVVDGNLGPKTITRWQQILKTKVDGFISYPVSALTVAVQAHLNKYGGAHLVVDGRGLVQDGNVYQSVAALQKHMGTPVDGRLSYPYSAAVKAVQTRLNKGTF
jgi:hypothetical protein